MAARIDEFGTPEAYNHYAVGWAHAMDTPYQWTKQVASHWGGTRNGTIVHWPQRHHAPGARSAPSSTTSSTSPPTVLEAAGLPEPTFVNGVQQMPLQGVSMAYTFDDAGRRRAPRDAVLRDVRQPRHLPQGLDGGDPAQHAVGARPRLPALDDDVWELYAPDDWTQAHDLAAEQPEKLRRAAAAVPDRGGQVQRAAARRPALRALQRRPGRPAAADPGQRRSCCSAGMGRLTRELGRSCIKNKSHAVTAQIDGARTAAPTA